jgi:hypothetical protein
VGAALASAAYATYVGATWLRYGHPSHPTVDERDELLDRFMPVYDVVERHHIAERRSHASAATTVDRVTPYEGGRP